MDYFFPELYFCQLAILNLLYAVQKEMAQAGLVLRFFDSRDHHPSHRDIFDQEKSFLIFVGKWWIFLRSIGVYWLFICGE